MINTQLGRIIIVDDETDVMTSLREYLSELGYEVAGYISAKDALEALKQKDFDLLLADLIMPEMDGITLLKAARGTDPYLFCIIITGKGTVETAVEAMKEGAFDFITKPVNWKILRPVVSRALEVRLLRKSEEKYRAIIEDQTELICRWLPDGTITFVNEVFCRYFNKPRHELIGHTSFRQFIPAEDYEEQKKRFTALIKENPVVLTEHRVILPTGEVRWQQWTNRSIFDEQGNIVEFQSVGQDITERVQADEELRISRNQLRELTKRLSEAEENERHRIAHELHDQVGQNLTALGINLNMLYNQLSDKVTTEIESRLNDSMKILEETSKKIRDVITDLRPTVLDYYGLMAAIRWYSDQLSKRTGLNISVHGEELIPHLPLEMEISLFRIAQEVLTNVAKHAMAGKVKINLLEEAGIIRMVIIDDGVGFESAGFYLSKEKNGWGLLNIRERTETLGGKLIIESEPGKGTRVAIEIKR